MKTKKNIVNKSFHKLQKVFGASMVILCLFSLESCENSFLDVVPDNITTLESAFKLRNEAKKYLYTCYAYIPKNGDGVYNIGMLAGDETWIPPNRAAITSFAFNIATGTQRKAETYMNAWEGNYQGAGPGDRYPLYDGIRHCNVFLENVEDRTKVPDLQEGERLRWIAEVKFLKAYYHYYLMRMYGPIPVVRVNVPIDASNDQIQVAREPIDSTVDYLVSLLDEAAVALPPMITDRLNELGRVTKPVALGMKAELLLMAASPLFNGNADMVGLNAKDGTPLFNPVYDATKWKRAANAAKEAIDAAEANGHKIFYKNNVAFTISQTAKTKLNITQAVTEPWNDEVIWANPNSRTYELQRLCMMPLASTVSHSQARKVFSPTLESATNFYTKNGVPIEEDKTLTFGDITELKEATTADKFNIKEGYRTSILNFNREPRFYADLGFDGAIFYKSSSGSDETKEVIRAKYQDYAGSADAFDFNVTGYYIKKLINWDQTFGGGTMYKEYAWPELRLADLYLMYAEALNEADGTAATTEVLKYVDLIRTRAGLSGVVDSWTNFSNNPAKYTTKDGMREIIHRERSIEMAFEGKNYWDIRRWKKATQEFNEPIKGWNVYGITEANYYQVVTLSQQRFVAPRDYFWPIEETTLIRNPNLIQNPGW
ncbi:RagB/SusD family nutrient uptake outer membrane protein [Flavobacterium sufflavum]|uniref:RagB/SusD family nutrient uptake outer membrane protein n=1 Tax=Flavobacterium sufflavum TaxID=1921138 RepID=A0A3S2V7N2_9FLAO|nr:RagB/SusD family nutrient uptake outer membrane protein [Flavobacterium sufflavum]RVT79758.1 RagB/SusD family nutrient uptake outer membrane protein [Flavobacterium sufflavum]